MIPSKVQFIIAAIAVVVIGIALVWGFLIVGSPFSARLKNLDDRRVDDLRAIHEAIQRMVIESADGKVKLKRSLPKTLDEVAAYVQSEQGQRKLRLRDPDTDAPYVYKVNSETKYELCATFEIVRDRQRDLFWNHPAGPHCFLFDAVEDERKRLADRGPSTR